MTILKRYWLSLFFTGIGFAAAALMYPKLPPRMPVHWNAQGQINGWWPKQEGVLALPVATLMTVLLMIALAPRVVRSAEPASLRRVYPTLVAAIAGFLLYKTAMILLVAAGVHFEVSAYRWIGTGMLLMIIGNSLGKVTRNGVVGIRTPWTLASEEVWSRTHRMGGWLFVFAGVATIIASVFGFGRIVGISGLIAGSAVAVVYSYMVSRRLSDAGHR